MTRRGHDLRVADRDPAHVIDRHRPLVIGQHVGRDATHLAQHPIQTEHHARQRPVDQRHDHPVARPGQPRAQQRRAPPADHRPIAIVELQPQPGLRDPRPRPPAMLGPPRPLRASDRPPRRAFRAHIAHRDQPLMRRIRMDRSLRTIHPLRDLLRERIDRRPRPRPRHQRPAARAIPQLHQPGDRLVITPHQRGGTAIRADQIERFQDLHHLLSRPHRAPTSTLACRAPHSARQTTPRPVAYRRDRGEPMAISGENSCPPAGNFDGRQWGFSHGRRHAGCRRAARAVFRGAGGSYCLGSEKP